MIPVTTADEARAADRAWAARTGLPTLLLMDRAARALAEVVVTRFPQAAARGVVCVTGPGNNGGDGWGAAVWLARWGVDVAVWPWSPEPPPGDAGAMREAACRLGIRQVERIGTAGVVVDALFGTGLTRPLEGQAAARVAAMEAADAVVVAADVPSGLDADRGVVLGVAPHADVTVSFGGLRRGAFTPWGRARCGELVPVGIGLDPATATAAVAEAGDLRSWCPSRPVDLHKGRAGRVLVVAGSPEMAGAAVLACRGALAAGAGLVTLLASERMLPRLASLPPEVMVHLGGVTTPWERGFPEVDAFDAVVAGPGLGGGRYLQHEARGHLASLWRSAEIPVVLDADALVAVDGPSGGPRVITPHPGEAARLLQGSVDEVQDDRFQAVERLASFGTVALLKGPHTLVSDGVRTWVNRTGAPTLATGGSGDVLAGFVGGLLAGGVRALHAAVLGAWAHGRAGEVLAAERAVGWTASDVADALPAVLASLDDDTTPPWLP